MAKVSDPHLLTKLGTLRQIEIFLKVAELGSIARAAEQLHLAQPSVSIQVRKLSEAIGLPLYEVIGKQLQLTEAGRAVVDSGHAIFSTIADLDEHLNELKGLKSGTLSIGVVTTAKYFLPYILGPFCERYPGIDIKMNIGNRSDIRQRMHDNLDDVYFVNEVGAELDVERQPFLDNPIAVIASRNHRLALRKTLRWDDIAQERFILREEGSDSMLEVDRFLRQRKLQIHQVMTIESNEAIKRAVMANMGISIISAYILGNADVDGLTQLNVEGFPIMSQWQVVTLRNKRLSSVAKEFIEFTTLNARNLLPMQTIEKNIDLAIKGIWGREHKVNK